MTPVPGYLNMPGHHGTGLSLLIHWSIHPMVVGASCADGGGLCSLHWALFGSHHQDC